MADAGNPEDALLSLIRLQIEAAIKTRRYLTVMFGGIGLAPKLTRVGGNGARNYESIWTTAVTRAMKAGVLQWADPRITTRLLLGMAIWVSRWYRESEGFHTRRDRGSGGSADFHTAQNNNRCSRSHVSHGASVTQPGEL